VNSSFQIGKYKPIYLWAGPGTIRMNKIKFMNYPVDEDIHREAHTLPTAKLVVDKIYVNWVHLMYDWGFHPEKEPQHRLANNALTIRNTREFVRNNAHLSVLSYDVGIGFDPVYPPRRHQQAVGEAAACGASMTIKGTEYNDGKRMTLLTDRTYYEQQVAIGDYHHWLEDHQDPYQNRKNTAPVGLMHKIKPL
jgi:hypothetical protein